MKWKDMKRCIFTQCQCRLIFFVCVCDRTAISEFICISDVCLWKDNRIICSSCDVSLWAWFTPLCYFLTFVNVVQRSDKQFIGGFSFINSRNVVGEWKNRNFSGERCIMMYVLVHLSCMYERCMMLVRCMDISWCSSNTNPRASINKGVSSSDTT